MDLNNIVSKFRKSIEYLTTELGSGALDGSPYLLICTVPGVREGTTIEVVYGEWDGKKSFKALDIVPDHLCGTIQMNSESLRKNTVALVEGGFSDGTKPIKVFGRHWREEYARRLVNYTTMVDIVEHAKLQPAC